jgi:hypothetical protein
MSFQENKKTEKYKRPLQQAFYIPCFSPESREWFVYTWQVFWLAAPVNTFPFCPAEKWYADSPVVNSSNDIYILHYPVTYQLTATGIAPELHRTSLLMAPMRQPNTEQM